MKPDLLLTNIGQVATLAGNSDAPKTGTHMSEVSIIEKGAIAIKEGKIIAVGPTKEILSQVEEEPKLPEENITSPFINELEKYFSKNSIEIIEKTVIRKASEMEYVIKVPSNVGSLVYFCKAKAKKKVNDGDLSSAFIQGQTKKLPVLFLTKGELTKKAKEMLDNEFRGMTLSEL